MVRKSKVVYCKVMPEEHEGGHFLRNMEALSERDDSG
jgi:hypothetical protein